MDNFIVELKGFEPFTMDSSDFRKDCIVCKDKATVIPYYLKGNLNTNQHMFIGKCSKCGEKIAYSSLKQFLAVCDYLYKTRSNIKGGTMELLNYNGSLTIGRKNKKLLKEIKSVSGSLTIREKINKLPDGLEVGNKLIIEKVCSDLVLKNLKVNSYIQFFFCTINKIYPSAQAKEYRVENLWNNTVLIFNNVYEIYEAFPHLVPDEEELQSKYGFDHIKPKDGAKIVPVVLGSITPKDAQKITKAKYIVVYSAEKQVLYIIKGNDYGNELYSEIFDVLPDIEY